MMRTQDSPAVMSVTDLTFLWFTYIVAAELVKY